MVTLLQPFNRTVQLSVVPVGLYVTVAAVVLVGSAWNVIEFAAEAPVTDGMVTCSE
jgi:hypothetical protein